MWVASSPCVVLLIFATIYDATFAYNNDLHWVKLNSARDRVPDDAVVGGNENGILYIVRAGHEGSITPGKFSVSSGQPQISWGRESHVKKDLEILCGRNYEWVPASKGSVPAGAFVGGRSENSLKENLYIGKANYKGNVIPGKVQPSHHTLYIAYDNKEISIEYYDVLVVPEKKNPDIILDGPKTVKKGESLNIECKIVQGKPTPSITWQFKAKGSSRFVSRSGSSNILYLGTVDARDEGTYKCIASNSASEVYRTTQVTVLMPPTIIQSLKVYTSVEEKDAQLQIPCTVTGSPKPDITWKANPMATYSIQDGTLVIKNPKVTDSGDYMCEARNSAGSTHATFKAVVQQVPKVSGTDIETHVKGQPVTINCNVLKGVPIPRITWQFKAKAETKFVSLLANGDEHRISKVDVKDAGVYKCIAQNAVGEDSHLTTLNVQIPPNIVSSSSAVYKAVEGQNTLLEIPCKTTGLPVPVISWKLNDKTISPGVKYSIQDGTLVIKNPKVTDSGDYSCEPRNDAGSTHATFKVIVHQIPKVTGTEVATHVKGQPVIIKCNVVEGVPIPTITWQFKAKDETRFTSLSAVVNELRISPVDVKDAGVYKCIAHNPAGEGAHLTTLNVQIPPKILSSSSIVYKTIEGTALQIPCNASGLPVPLVTWKSNGKTLSSDVNYLVHDGTLVIKKAKVSDSKTYTCEARNEAGVSKATFQANILQAPKLSGEVTKTIVKVVPFIISGNSNIYGLKGDVALKIPCNVVGVPQPTITWKINNTVITPNARYSIINGALIIKDPKLSDSNLYTCEARNYLGLAKGTFIATVDEYLEDYGTIHEVNVLKGTTTKLKCGSADTSQSIRWFLEGVDLGVKGKSYDLKNVDDTFDGNYTCRVSDMNGAWTDTYVVIVGYPPEFDSAQDDPFLDWSGSEFDDLDCEVKAIPSADVVWSFNGEVLSSQNSFRLAVPGNWGHYTCNVSNIHGAIQRSFDVISSKCLIRRKPNNVDSMPLILSSAYTWPLLDSTTDYLPVESEDTVIFSCPKFKDEINFLQNMSGVNKITATCVKQDVFKVQDVEYKVSDFQCAQPVHSVVVNKHEKCLGATSEVIRVGYEVHGFLETYEVCFDVSKNTVLFSRAVMSKTNRGSGNTYSWHKYPELSSASGDTAHTCTNSRSSCCYTKTQLVNARDVSDGPPQKSTFIDPLNAIPLWLPCVVPHGQSPWASIEDTVRSRLDLFDQFVVWSGTHKIQNINGSAIPRYLWKVVRFAADDTLAIIYVNGPSPSTADILCRNICADNKIVPWIHEHDDHTYCCQVDEFLSAFGLSATTVGKGALDNNISKK